MEGPLPGKVHGQGVQLQCIFLCFEGENNVSIR